MVAVYRFLTLMVGMILLIGAITLVAILVPQPRTRWRRMPKSVFWIGQVLVFVACAAPAYRPAARVAEYVALCGAYGADAYSGGLRLVDKFGNLSDGRVLPDVWQGIAFGGIFGLMGLATLPTILFYVLFSGRWDSVRQSPRQGDDSPKSPGTPQGGPSPPAEQENPRPPL